MPRELHKLYIKVETHQLYPIIYQVHNSMCGAVTAVICRYEIAAVQFSLFLPDFRSGASADII
jgi:hypothetical protein